LSVFRLRLLPVPTLFPYTTLFRSLAASSRVVPYVVQVDRLGQVVTVGAADELKRPDQRLIASQLAQFVRAIRTVLPAAALSESRDRKSTRLNSSHLVISYAVFCLK